MFNGVVKSFESSVPGNAYSFVSYIIEKNTTDKRYYIYINGKKSKIKDIMMLDLTDSFGEGNEPSKEYMDRLIEHTGYFDTQQIAVQI